MLPMSLLGTGGTGDDSGCVDSGIHDEMLREKLKVELRGDHAIKWLTRFVREQCVSEQAEAHGYTVEDAASFIKWLSDRMDYDL